MGTFDFTGVATGAWSDSNFFQINDGTNYTPAVVVAETANGAIHALGPPTSAPQQSLCQLVGRTWGPVLSVQATVNGTRGFLVTDDGLFLSIHVASGGSQWFGYHWKIGNTFQRPFREDAYPPPDVTGLASNTTDTIAEGDTFFMSYNTANGALVGKHNGTTLFSVTDTTYRAASLTVGFGLEDGNHGGTGISLLVTTGDSVGTPYPLPSLYFVNP